MKQTKERMPKTKRAPKPTLNSKKSSTLQNVEHVVLQFFADLAQFNSPRELDLSLLGMKETQQESAKTAQDDASKKQQTMH